MRLRWFRSRWFTRLRRRYRQWRMDRFRKKRTPEVIHPLIRRAPPSASKPYQILPTACECVLRSILASHLPSYVIAGRIPGGHA
jgi:hypothetical protein